jgi:hypothetical protein
MTTDPAESTTDTEANLFKLWAIFQVVEDAI